MKHSKTKMGFRIIAILASGLMVAALVPPYSFSGLAWFCIVPLILVLWTFSAKHQAKKGFLVGYLVGAISFGIQVSWLSTVTPIGPVVLAGYLALFWGAFGAFAATLGNPWYQRDLTKLTPLSSLGFGLINASAFAGLEVARGYFLTGFSWNTLGTAFHDTFVISQAADLLGVSGLSLLLVFFQTVIVQASRRLVLSARIGKKAARWDFFVAASCIALVIGYGLFRINTESRKEGIQLEALLVQVNIPHEGAQVLWSGDEVHLAYEDDTLAALKKIDDENETALREAIEASETGAVSLKKVDWVIWPETALTGRILTTKEGISGSWIQNTQTIDRVRESSGNFDLIYGAIEIEGEMTANGIKQSEDARGYNSMVVHRPDGSLHTFRKQHLVIFGETIPFMDSIPLLRAIYEQQVGQPYGGSFAAGNSTDPIELEVNGKKIQIIPSICFEDSVARLTLKFLRNSPQVIVNITNDGWFKTSPAAEQHFANSRFRAIEFRRPMLRCANTGVSAAINTLGSTYHSSTGINQRIMAKNGSPFVRGSKLVELSVPVSPTTTLYSILGDWGLTSFSILGLISAIWLRRKRPDSKNI